ncbi:MAG: TetR/AcrR family transcriptional regulator [Firmicutes bacterium]|nr:TetR/AcrR family transcriptional regulator [Bacillota bacterium]
MPKNENCRPVQGEETKERILQAAAEVFAEKSFHAATISEITNRAGVAKGTLYWYFPGKEGLFIGMMEEVFSTLLQRVMKIKDDPDLSTSEKFHRIILEYLRVFGGSRLGKVILNNIREFTMEFHYKLQQWNKEFYRLNRALFEKGVAEGLVRTDWDIRQMATALAGIVIEFGKVHMLGESRYSLEESADFIYSLLFEGIGVDEKVQ